MPETVLNDIERSFEPVIAEKVYTNQFSTVDEEYFFGSKSGSSNIKELNYLDIVTDPTTVTTKEDNVVFLTFSERQNSVTQNDTININDSEVQKLIFRIKTTMRIPDNATIANRLLNLFDLSKEDEPDFIGIEIESLKSFYAFLLSNTNLKRPLISLTPDNNIYASWRGDEGRVFSIHFLPDSDVNFVIFTPNKKRPERKTRTAGKTTFDMLMEIEANAYNLYDWISK